MQTKVRAVFSNEAPASKCFHEFDNGDVLYVLDSNAIGIKVNEHSIRFITLPSGAPQVGAALAKSVSPSHRYGVPTSVDIRVTR